MARLRPTWEIDECGRYDGYMRVDSVEVTYRALGRTRHAAVPLVMPFVVTTRDLDDIRAEIVASLER